MKQQHFFAMISRMKYINRWGLMNNTNYENLCEHSHQVAVLAHALVIIHNKRFQGNLNGERAALLGLYHDASEIITGDMPTPVKYFNTSIKQVYKDIEKHAENKLLSMLPEDLQPDYAAVLSYDEQDAPLWKFIKAADKLSALIKCMEELKLGNREFASAQESIQKALTDMHMPEVDLFMNEFLPSYSLTLDQQE